MRVVTMYIWIVHMVWQLATLEEYLRGAPENSLEVQL